MIEPYGWLEDEVMIYLLGTIAAALRLSMRASIFASIGSILACDFLFIPPRMQFAWTDARKTLTFLGMIVVAAVISWLSERLRFQEMVARRAAGATRRSTSSTSSSRERRHEAFGFGDGSSPASAIRGEVVILLRGASGELDSANPPVGPEELALAERAWVSGDLATSVQAGRFSLWVPVLGIREPLAVIGLEVPTVFDRDSEAGLLLAACARELATAIERMQLANAARHAARCRDRADA